MMGFPQVAGLTAAVLISFTPLPDHLSAQETPPPNRGGFTTSMGIPRSVSFAAGFTAGVHRGDVNETTTYLFGSLYRDLINPAVAGK